MNWFERYGIVGTFFFAMTALWFFGLFPDSFVLFKSNKEFSKLLTYAAKFSVFTFLPIGYLVVILGQWLYYSQKNIWERIHCNLWENLNPGKKRWIIDQEKAAKRDLSEKEQEDEARMEAVITYYDRTNPYLDVNINKYLSEFGTKRYATIAINRGFTLAIPISLIFAIWLKLFSLETSLQELRSLWIFPSYNLRGLLDVLFFPFLTVFIFFAIWITLSWSSSVLEHQIFEIAKIKLGCLTSKKEIVMQKKFIVPIIVASELIWVIGILYLLKAVFNVLAISHLSAIYWGLFWLVISVLIKRIVKVVSSGK